MAMKKPKQPARWRSREAAEIARKVTKAGGEVERTGTGNMKIKGPSGVAYVAAAPSNNRTGGRGLHNTLATIAKETGLQL